MDTTKYRTQIPVKKDGIFAYEIYLEKRFWDACRAFEGL